MGVWVPYVAIPCVVLINLIAYASNENSWAWRRLRGARPGLLAVSNRAAGVSCQQRPTSFWAWELIDSSASVTSWVVPQWVLLALRLSALLFFAALFIVLELAYTLPGPTWLVYFTNWSFCAFALSMLLGSAHTAADMRRRRRRQRQLAGSAAATASAPATAAEAPEGQQQLLSAMDPADPEAPPQPAASAELALELRHLQGLAPAAAPLVAAGVPTTCSAGGAVPAGGAGAAAASWGLLAKAHLLAAEVAFPAELFLTAFYWALLHADDEGPLGSTLMVHGLNNLFTLADVALSGMPFVSYHFLALLLYGSTYLAFMWIYYGASGIWAYSVLDWSKSSSMLYYLLLPLLLAAGFFAYVGVACLRERCVRRRGQAQQQQQQGGAAADKAAGSSLELRATPVGGMLEP